jgi:hypothetical protein
MLTIRKGFPVAMEREIEVRSTWPPPSPMDPSIVIKSLIVFFCSKSGNRLRPKARVSVGLESWNQAKRGATRKIETCALPL